jgi:hypothetical protein
MTEPPSTPTGASILPAGSDSSEVLTDREQVLASFTSIQWDTYGRTMLDAGEVRVEGTKKGRTRGFKSDKKDLYLHIAPFL